LECVYIQCNQTFVRDIELASVDIAG
jgi:hypothetical protein